MLSVNLAVSVMEAELHNLALYAGCRFPECHYADCRGAKETKFEKSIGTEILKYANKFREIKW
jgi:hypothetical protein